MLTTEVVTKYFPC